MRIAIAISVLTVIGLPLAAQVSTVARSETKDVVPAFDSSGAITLPIAHSRLDLDFPRGKKERREFTVVYAPKTGHYLWHCSPENEDNPSDKVRPLVMKSQGSVPFADSIGLIDFGFGSGLFAKVWRSRADSLDAAVSAALSEIRQGLAVFEGLDFGRDYKLVPVFGGVLGFDVKIPPGYKQISSEFFCKLEYSICPDAGKNTIVSITKQGSNFRLVLRNRFDVEAIVDQDLNLVSSRQLTEPFDDLLLGPPRY